LSAVHDELAEIERTIQTATDKHNEFLLELGVPLLPAGSAGSSD
jgi:type I restriction enzyme M protein